MYIFFFFKISCSPGRKFKVWLYNLIYRRKQPYILLYLYLQGYQFWTRSNSGGDFVIKNIRPGRYNLYAWVPGFLGDFMHKSTITINPGLILLFHSGPPNFLSSNIQDSELSEQYHFSPCTWYSAPGSSVYMFINYKSIDS